MKRVTWGAVRSVGLAIALGLSASAVSATPLKNANYWVAYEAKLAAMGLMRAEREPTDAPYTNADLVRHFGAIMLHREHTQRGSTFVKDAAPRRLKKMPAEVTVQIGGSTVGPADRANVQDMMQRLARVTGVRVVESGHDPIVRLMILTAEERRAVARQADASPRWRFMAQHLATGMSSAVCTTYYSRDRSRPGRVDYLIVIPAEVTGLLRQSCIEEELGQAFGPGADFDQARPSIFNDDSEFALMTRHDEDLLRILYDPRLKAGMTAEQAMPLVTRIVEELRPGQ